jgi:hypothetical protein
MILTNAARFHNLAHAELRDSASRTWNERNNAM